MRVNADEPNSAPPPRWRPKLHLLTLLLLTIASGALLGINIRNEEMQLSFADRDSGQRVLTIEEAKASQELSRQWYEERARKKASRSPPFQPDYEAFLCQRSHGWPFPAYARARFCYFVGDALREDQTRVVSQGFIPSGVALNTLIALLIVSIITITIEWSLRKRSH